MRDNACAIISILTRGWMACVRILLRDYCTTAVYLKYTDHHHFDLHKRDELLMMMIAFITFNSSLVPLFEGV